MRIDVVLGTVRNVENKEDSVVYRVELDYGTKKFTVSAICDGIVECLITTHYLKEALDTFSNKIKKLISVVAGEREIEVIIEYPCFHEREHFT